MNKVVCSWCHAEITFWNVPRCRDCNKPVCPPVIRDCALAHWNANHEAPLPKEREVEEVAGP